MVLLKDESIPANENGRKRQEKYEMKPNPVKTIGAACLILLLVLLPASLSWGGKAKIVHLEDGDSGTALYQGRGVKFRLYGIDAPEWKQDFGGKAKFFSSRLMLRKVVEMEVLEHDRYDREVALIFVDGKCVNEELVKAGLAWVYVQYCKIGRCGGWLRLQEEAKQKRLGLWGKKRPLPPWEYRERQRPDRSSPGWSLLTRLMGDYRGNENSRVFHRKGCKYYDCERCTVVFSSRDEALRKGYTPCRMCKP
jgi:endonuclease YncB( thermonuclease family)